jgi:hypothetical protein
LPHSEILGSKPVCGSPKLIAAYHVLHRLLAPRHSPYALSSLTIMNSELTLTAARLPGPRHAIAPCTLPPPTPLHAPTDFVVGKNYRLQDIQLSKTNMRSADARASFVSAGTSDSTIRAQPGASRSVKPVNFLDASLSHDGRLPQRGVRPEERGRAPGPFRA